MTLQDMRDFVRAALDTDTTDLPDALLDRYILDGSNRIDSHSNEWSFRAVDYTFNTVNGTQAYLIRGASLVSGVTLPVVNVTDVRAPNWSLRPGDHQKLRRDWRATSTNKSNPTDWTLWGNSIYLWPIPGSVQAISITGYRDGIDWVTLGASSKPDFPDDFHEMIAWWALNRAHAREGDAQMSDFYRSEFGAALKDRADNWTQGLDAQPLVVGGRQAASPWRTQTALGPLIYPWE